jgi:hypothetical protein
MKLPVDARSVMPQVFGRWLIELVFGYRNLAAVVLTPVGVHEAGMNLNPKVI